MINFIARKKKTVADSVPPKELDLSFYRQWYDDLASLSDARLVRHWLKEGKEEARSPDFGMLLDRENIDVSKLPDGFEWQIYAKLNPDVELASRSEYHATYHFLTVGIRDGRPYRFGHEFYLSMYDELASLTRLDDAISHWLQHGKDEGRFPTLEDLLASYGVDPKSLPFELDLLCFARLNPDEQFKNVFDAVAQIVQQSPVRKLRPHEADSVCADFYVQLALHQERMGHTDRAGELFQLSLLFCDNPTAHEHLGNIAQRANLPQQAIAHYQAAIEARSRSPWVCLNLAETLASTQKFAEAVDVIIQAAESDSNLDSLAHRLHQILSRYWATQEQLFTSLAVGQRRTQLMEATESASSFVSDSFRRFFTKFSPDGYSGTINKSKVLIIGAFGLAQCYRYRIAQKKEQLEIENYEVSVVNYLKSREALDSINFSDLIIFYRVPANVETIRMVEYARAAGKITYFDIDDLLVDPSNPPPIETYGGLVSPAVYTNLVKDTATFRAAAKLCDFAISSTEPLLQRLTDLVRTKRGFLHRNALDSHILPLIKDRREKSYISIFYGTGTLAHNSDFTEIALPSIERVLSKHRNVKFVAVGHLKLPAEFLKKYPEQIAQLPIIQKPEVYLHCMSAADINIAVLHDNPSNDCKSEIKWMEAAYFGIPSVVSSTKNYVDVIDNGVDGYLASNETQWFEYLDRLIVDPELRLRIGKAASEKVRSQYAPSALAKNLRTLLNSSISYRALSR